MDMIEFGTAGIMFSNGKFKGENMLNYPKIFCITKVGIESGESRSSIIERKDKEREQNDGIFFWGIGNSLGEKFWDFIESTKNPSIIFLSMKAKAKDIDINPTRTFIWTKYINRKNQIIELPETIKIINRQSKLKMWKALINIVIIINKSNYKMVLFIRI